MVKLFKFFGVMALASAPSLVVCWTKSFVVQRASYHSNPIDVTDDQSIPGNDPAIAGIETDGFSLDSTERQIVLLERDPTTGSSFFSVNGSPVQGKLKAYLDAAWEEGKLIGFKNHPDGESSTWVEIPMPRFLYLTDHLPSP